MADPQVRPAAETDASALAAVYRSAYSENRNLGFPASAEAATQSAVATWIRHHQMFVADIDGEVVGGVRLSVTNDDRVKLSRLGVRDDRKREGIGRTLLDHAEEWATESGYDAVWLTTPPEHPYLPAFYRTRGYERVGEYPLESRDYDEVVLEKSLR